MFALWEKESARPTAWLCASDPGAYPGPEDVEVAIARWSVWAKADRHGDCVAVPNPVGMVIVARW
jgi:hypothetical protein